jgi:hypothetical protein
MWLGVFAPITSQARIARLELHTLQTKTFTDQEMLTGSTVGKPATIVGELRIPRAGNDRLPAVVLMHGSGGGSSREDGWARELNALGAATFIVDHFTGRGIVSTVNDRVEEKCFRLLTPIEELSLYQWHTKTAKDYFCSNCGILPFRRPRTAPDLWGINVRCLEGVDLSSIPIKYVYGSRLD